MARYIDADALYYALMHLCEKFNVSFGGESKGFGKALAELPETLPAADVRPERHGKWIYSYTPKHTYAKCSVCRYTRNPITQTGWDYCPNCGARMDGKETGQ
ncbi:MAG: hypothetical protein NC299_17250 [Lachnospiraceae bacterium]|nr:hypothetical protein [Ruminococcus sp.]MCM1277078.1 hypothetical protein [Lachnospiraceae bacterium]